MIKKNIIIKIGTSCIFNKNNKDSKLYDLSNLFYNIEQLFKLNFQVWLVSSGGIFSGLYHSNSINNNKINKYSLFNFGWNTLVNHYDNFLLKKNIISIPKLVRKNDINKNIDILLYYLNDKQQNEFDYMPILNEDNFFTKLNPNQAFIDNDELTYYLANKINPEYTIFLSSVEGVYADLEMKNKINILEQNADLNFNNNSKLGTGGMKNKIELAFKIAKKTHSKCFIASGLKENTILDIVHGIKNIGTFIKI